MAPWQRAASFLIGSVKVASPHPWLDIRLGRPGHGGKAILNKTKRSSPMKLYGINRSQILPVSLEKAWQFFSSPINLPIITPPWLNLKVTREVAEPMFPGMIICFKLTPFFGVPLTWITEITHVNAPFYFVDEQRFGPYRFWHHQHHFSQVKGGVEIVDTVSYALRLGPVGSLLHAVYIGNKLKQIFDFRQKKLKQMFDKRPG